MRKLTVVAGLAAAALIPSLAFAQPSCGQQDDRIVGTVVGAGIGALPGSVVAGKRDRTAGACTHAYGYYDRNGQWHANAIDRANAAGYYDRYGAWIDGAPNGYYDQSGRWVTAPSDASPGYTDSRGRWIPSSANGYYDDGGAWVNTASGYYDGLGHWVAGQTTGAYDRDGRWMPGARSGHADGNGMWVADAQPGYYDARGSWIAGPANGYYDARGSWIAISSNDRGHTPGLSHESDRDPAAMPLDLVTREGWLDQRIRSAGAEGKLTPRQVRRNLGELNSIRRRESRMRYGAGELSRRDEVHLQARLDRLGERLRLSLNGT